MDRIGDGLKKVLLAGIGAIAITGEKSQEVVESLVKKGELTVEQGKVLNQELKHNFRSKVDDAKENVKAKKKDAEKKDLTEMIKDMSAEQLAQVELFLEKIKADEAVKKAAELAGEFAGKAKEAADEVMGKAEEVAEDVAEDACEAAEDAEEAVEAAEEAADVVEEAVEAAAETVSEAAEEATEAE